MTSQRLIVIILILSSMLLSCESPRKIEIDIAPPPNIDTSNSDDLESSAQTNEEMVVAGQ